MQDLIPSFTVGLIAFPLAISFSTAIGIAPQAGFVATIIGGIVGSIFGGTRFIITGPNTAFFLVGIEAMTRIGPHGLFLATFLAGLFLVASGFLKLGIVLDYIPYSVILGFSSGIGIVIVSTLLKDCLGILAPLKSGNFVLQSWFLYFKEWQHINIFAVMISSAVIYFMRQYRKSPYPVFVAVLIISTFIAWILGLPIETIGSRYKDFSAYFPKLQHLDILSLSSVIDALPFALTITSLSIINALLATAVVHDKTNTPVNANHELIAQGIANMSVALFSGIPVTATMSRTITNIENKAKTPMAGVFQALIVFLFLLFSVPLLKKVPFACLNAVFLSVAIDMLAFRKLWEQIKLPHGEPLVCFVTFFMTIFLDNGVAIMAGTMIASLLFIHQMSQVTQVHSRSYASDIQEGIKIYHIDGPFFFGAASRLKIVFEEPHLKDKIIILNLKNMPLIDTTGSLILSRLIKQNPQTEFILTNMNKDIKEFFEKSGLSKKRHYIVTRDMDTAIAEAHKILRKTL